MKKLLLLLIPALALSGCAVRSVKIGQAYSEGIVTVPETPRTVGASAASIIANFLTSVLPTMGQTRRKAMEERMNYTERRGISVFSIEYQDKKDEPEAVEP